MAPMVLTVSGRGQCPRPVWNPCPGHPPPRNHSLSPLFPQHPPRPALTLHLPESLIPQGPGFHGRCCNFLPAPPRAPRCYLPGRTACVLTGSLKLWRVGQILNFMRISVILAGKEGDLLLPFRPSSRRGRCPAHQSGAGASPSAL